MGGVGGFSPRPTPDMKFLKSFIQSTNIDTKKIERLCTIQASINMHKLCKQNIQSLGLTMTPPNEAVLKYSNTQ